MSTNTAATSGHAHMDAYRTALRKRDFPAALRELVAAIQSDARQYAPFPVGKYLPQRIVRSESAGVSFLCRQKDTGDTVLVKALTAESYDRPLDQVLSDARVTQQINHPVFVRVRDAGFVDPANKSRAFIVTDHFDGTPLEDYVLQNGPLPLADVQSLAVPIAAAMQAAHDQNLIYRNLRPQNVLIRRVSSGAPWEVRLIDVGLSVRPTAWGVAAVYAAPEQVNLINAEVGKATDIFGFGKTCCLALFQTALPQLKHWKSIPAPLAEFLERCVAENPADRPADFHAVARVFARVQAVADLPAQAEVPTVAAVAYDPAMPPPPRTAVASELRRATAAPPTVPVAPRRRDYEPPDYPRKKGTPIGLILAIGAGVLALAFLGILAVVLVFVLGGSDDSKDPNKGAAASANTDRDPDPIPPAPGNGGFGNGGFGKGGLGNGGLPNVGGGIPNPLNQPPPPIKDRPRKITLTIKGVPNAEAAKFVEERLKHALAGDKEDFRFGGDGPPASLQGAVAYAGTELTATLETHPSRRQPREVLAAMDLGPVDDGGETMTIEVTPPPDQSRIPEDKAVGQQLQKAQVQAVIVALRNTDPFKGREREQALDLLAASKPSDDSRATVRTLLRGFIAKKDPFQTDRAIKALGAWGTEEDATYLTAQFPADNFGPKESVCDALARLRSPQAATYLAQYMGNFFAHERCARALRAIGPSAEKAVAGVLTNNDKNTRLRAAQFLKDYGSGASIKALQSAAADADKEASKAAWDAWKTIAFHNPKPSAASGATGNAPPVTADKPTTETIDDLKVTTLSKSAADVQTVAAGADDAAFFTLDRDGTLRRWPADGTAPTSAAVGRGAVMCVGADGVLVAGGGDVKLFDANNLESKSTGTMNPVKAMSAASRASVAVLRSESNASLYVLDVGGFAVKSTLTDKKIPTFGKSDPTVTADGRFVVTRDNGKLYRWRIENFKMIFSESSDSLGAADAGQIVMSRDGKYVALFYPDGNPAAAKVGTLVYEVANLKKPAFTIPHGAKTAALALDGKGGALASHADGTLTLFGPSGAKGKSYKLGAAAKQIAVAQSGDKLLVLTDSKLMRLELPK